MGCFVRGGQKRHGMFCPGMFSPTFPKITLLGPSSEIHAFKLTDDGRPFESHPQPSAKNMVQKTYETHFCSDVIFVKGDNTTRKTCYLLL